MKTKVTPKLLDTVMQIGQARRSPTLHFKILCIY